MTHIGRMNTLKVIEMTDHGARLDGKNLGSILLPNKYVPKSCSIGDEIDVFISLDSDDRLVATTRKPFAMVGEFAALKVVATQEIGSFLDWGLEKDLFVPFREQRHKMKEGSTYVVYIYLDEKSNRIAASARLNRFITAGSGDLKQGQAVDLLIYDKTDLGYKALINGQYSGVIFHSDVFQPLRPAQAVSGYIKKLRKDSKIDLCIQKPGYAKVDDLAEKILRQLKQQNGRMAITSATPSETINNLFGVSKKSYKKAIGNLYKKRLITIEEDCIRLVEDQ